MMMELRRAGIYQRRLYWIPGLRGWAHPKVITRDAQCDDAEWRRAMVETCKGREEQHGN